MRKVMLTAVALAGAVSITACNASTNGTVTTTEVQEIMTETDEANENAEDAEERESGTEDSDALVIAEQGTFTAGGRVTTSAGTFDPVDQMNPQGQPIHDGPASVFYQIPENAKVKCYNKVVTKVANKIY